MQVADKGLKLVYTYLKKDNLFTNKFHDMSVQKKKIRPLIIIMRWDHNLRSSIVYRYSGVLKG
jgi:hypothetical protein